MGLDTHFRFSPVPPRKFVLYSKWIVGDNIFRWLVPVPVAARDSASSNYAYQTFAIHKTLRVTPAMAANVTPNLGTMSDLLHAALLPS